MSKTPPDHEVPANAPHKSSIAQAVSQLGAQSPSITVQQSSFSGPLPPPDVLERYEHIHKGTADRVIAMAEEEGHHRRALEKGQLSSDVETRQFTMETDRRTIEHGFRIQHRGQNYALISVVAVLMTSAYFVLHGAQLGGGLLGGGGIVALAYVFINGHKVKTAKNTDNNSLFAQQSTTDSPQKD